MIIMLGDCCFSNKETLWGSSYTNTDTMILLFMFLYLHHSPTTKHVTGKAGLLLLDINHLLLLKATLMSAVTLHFELKH